jgi:hypothetical protein
VFQNVVFGIGEGLFIHSFIHYSHCVNPYKVHNKTIGYRIGPGKIFTEYSHNSYCQISICHLTREEYRKKSLISNVLEIIQITIVL